MGEESLKAKTVALIRRGRQLERETVAALSPTQRDAVGTAERWAIKDKVVHVNAWKAVIAENLQDARAGRTPDTRNDAQAFNDATLELYRHHSWADVAQYANDTTNALIAEIESYSDEALGQVGLYEWVGERTLAEHAIATAIWHGIMHMTEPYLERGEGAAALRMLDDIFSATLEVLQTERAIGTAKYNQACVYAQMGMADAALNLLSEAFTLRPELKPFSKEDSDLTNVWESPMYQELVAA
jgi:hypothetical protein